MKNINIIKADIPPATSWLCLLLSAKDDFNVSKGFIKNDLVTPKVSFNILDASMFKLLPAELPVCPVLPAFGTGSGALLTALATGVCCVLSVLFTALLPVFSEFTPLSTSAFADVSLAIALLSVVTSGVLLASAFTGTSVALTDSLAFTSISLVTSGALLASAFTGASSTGFADSLTLDAAFSCLSFTAPSQLHSCPSSIGFPQNLQNLPMFFLQE